MHCTLTLQHTKRATSTLCAEIPANFCHTLESSQSHTLDSHHSKSPHHIFSTLPSCKEFKSMKKPSSVENLSVQRIRQSCSDNLQALSAQRSLQFSSRQCKQLQVLSYVLPAICSYPEKKKKKDSFLKLRGEYFLLMVRSCS